MIQYIIGIIGAGFALGGITVVLVMIAQDFIKHYKNR